MLSETMAKWVLWNSLMYCKASPTNGGCRLHRTLINGSSMGSGGSLSSASFIKCSSRAFISPGRIRSLICFSASSNVVIKAWSTGCLPCANSLMIAGVYRLLLPPTCSFDCHLWFDAAEVSCAACRRAKQSILWRRRFCDLDNTVYTPLDEW